MFRDPVSSLCRGTPARSFLLVGWCLSLAAGLLAAGAAAAAESTSIVVGTGSRVIGSGKVIEEVRPVTGFGGLVVNGPVDVQLKASSAERVTVRADDNILPLIETRIEDGKLVVGTTRGASFRTRNPLRVTVEFTSMSVLAVNGSGDVRADRLRAQLLDVTIRGSGDVAIDAVESDAVALLIVGSGDFTASGRAASLGVSVSGSGDVNTENLVARDVGILISGSGDAKVHATETLQVTIAGSGDVRYRGQPKVTKKIAGSGDVRPLR
jgi:hypothetical protein